MAFKKKSVDFLQKERDELSHLRPVIIFVTAPVMTARTSQYKHFQSDIGLQAGLLKRDANPINFCLIEASNSHEELSKQITTALELYKNAPHKEVVLNAHGSPEGILLSGENEEKSLLTGEQFAKMVLPHTHDHFLHVFIFAAYGHVFAQSFYATVRSESGTQSKIATTYFTSVSNPLSWDRISTAGTGHVEVTRDIKEYIKTNMEPNKPHKLVDNSVQPCTIL